MNGAVLDFQSAEKAENVLISPGSVLIKEGTQIPPSVGFSFKKFRNWQLVAGLGSFEISRKVSNAGWYISFLVPERRSFAIGLNSTKALRTALERLMDNVEAQNFNAVEMTSVNFKQFLGISLVRVSGHPRHLRNNPFVRDFDPHRRKHARDSSGIYQYMNRRAQSRKAI
jgi:hypothetical protein